MLLIIELCLTAIAVPLSYAAPRLGNHWFGRVEPMFQTVARRRPLAVLAIFVLAVAARMAVLPVEPVPKPGVHDDYSYLLMGDTFAHGRLTNPTHPMWVHFETVHVNQRPTYCSMYYPAQGLFLAFGQVVFGHPFWGVVFSTAFMCAAICWALQAWMPPQWAFLAGVLAILRLGTFSYWANSYYGGAVAAIGGALAIGALLRIKRHQRIRDAVILGLGLALSAASRPYETIFFSIPILISLVVWPFTSRTLAQNVFWRRVVMPFALVVVLASSSLAYYFWRTTGNPLRPPYLVNLETYFVMPNFPWLPLHPMPHYNHEILQRVYSGYPVHYYEATRNHPFPLTVIKLCDFWTFFLGPLLTVPLLGLVLIRGARTKRPLSRKTWFLTCVCLSCAAGNLLPVGYLPHYSAPITGALYGIVVQGLRHLRLWCWERQPTGRTLSRMLVLIAICLFAIRWTIFPVPQGWHHNPQNLDRARMCDSLTHESGKHLAIVRYDANHNPESEWVYNAADIDASKVVWAQDMGEEKNQELIDYYKNRQVWLVLPDETPPRLMPYGEYLKQASKTK